MTEEEIEKLLEHVEWKMIGSGQYNQAVVSLVPLTIDGYTSYWVERRPQDPTDLLSNTERAIRKWRLMNPQYPVHKTRHGMLTPFFGPLSFIDSKEPIAFSYSDDNHRSEKLLETYRRTKNLIYDMGVISNVIVYNNPYTNEEEDVVVDPDFAFEVGSVATDEHYQTYVEKDFLTECKQRGMVKTATLVEIIRYIETQLPPEKIPHHRITRSVCERLIQFFDHQLPITEKLLNFLLDWQDADPTNAYQLETLPVQLLLQENFFPDTSPLTKAQLAQVIVDYILENMGQEKESELIRHLTIAFTHNHFLKNKLSQQGYALTHLAVIHGYESLLRFLIYNGVDIGIKTPDLYNGRKFNNANMTVFEVAFIIISLSLETIRLLQIQGANSANSLQNNPQDSFHHLLKVYMSCYETLVKFCNNQIQTLWDTRYPTIMENIQKYPELLTWPIDNMGYTVLHHIFRRNDRAVIHYLMSMSYWPQLKLTRNLRNQHTLFDFMAIHGNLNFYDSLKSLASTPAEKIRVLSLAVKASQLGFILQLLKDGYNPNDTLPHVPSLLFIAGQQGSEATCTLLLNNGANPKSYRSNHPKYKEWCGPEAQNPIKIFAAKLKNLCKGLASAEKEAEWIDFLQKYPWFLDWPLSESGSTFLHYCFRANRTHIISGLLSHPKWRQLAKTVNSKSGITLFDEIIMAGHLDYYEELKPNPKDRSAYDKALNKALIYATKMGQVQSCLRLISDGANPEIIVPSRNVPCYQYWAVKHFDKENPFTEYFQKIWQQQKKNALEKIEQICTNWGISEYHFFAFNKQIKNHISQFKKRIRESKFNIQTKLEENIAKILEEYLQNIDTTLSTTEQQIIQSILNEIGYSLGIPTICEHIVIAVEELPAPEANITAATETKNP